MKLFYTVFQNTGVLEPLIYVPHVKRIKKNMSKVIQVYYPEILIVVRIFLVKLLYTYSREKII